MYSIKSILVFIIVILIIIAGGWLYFHKPVPAPAKISPALPCQSFKSGPRDRKKLALPDGSIITLFPNTGLKLSCHFTDSSRDVSLDGEAFFEVKHDPAKPFIVISKDLFVSTTGGVLHFQGYSSEAGEQIELLRGSATVRKTHASPDSAGETLHAGEMVMINRSIDLMEKEGFDTASLSAEIRGLSRQ